LEGELDCVIFIINHLTKWAVSLPAIQYDLTAQAFVTKFCNFYVRLQGVSDMIISNQVPRFIGKFWTLLIAILKVKLSMSGAYHPQTNRQTEKVNHVIGIYLRALHPLGEFAYNLPVYASTGKALF
jgi:hypothetical protein